jgi:3-phosphoshikimate 1-carboxyvinyltransferase
MLEALTTLGVAITGPDEAGTCIVRGTGGVLPVSRADLFLGNAGTAFRPLTAALALAGGEYALRGVPRMHERPIGDLVDALRALGANVRYEGVQGFPPLTIGRFDAARVPVAVPIRGSVSSQFLSALLMALPLLTARTHEAMQVDVVGELVSRPYVTITTNLMQRFGVKVDDARRTDARSARASRETRRCGRAHPGARAACAMHRPRCTNWSTGVCHSRAARRTARSINGRLEA